MQKMLIKVYNSKKITLAFKAVSFVSVLVTAAAFFALVISSFLQDRFSALKLVLATAIPFLAVTVFRRIVNTPRPYEVYTFYEKKPKEKKGLSFPSRHVFSTFVIAAVSISSSIYLAIGLFLVGIALAVSRVLLGIHFIRDVIAGAVIGTISGAIGLLTILL